MFVLVRFLLVRAVLVLMPVLLVILSVFMLMTVDVLMRMTVLEIAVTMFMVMLVGVLVLVFHNPSPRKYITGNRDVLGGARQPVARPLPCGVPSGPGSVTPGVFSVTTRSKTNCTRSGRPQIRVVANDFFEELAATQRPVEALRQTHFHLPEG
jgi:hypothetical protein